MVNQVPFIFPIKGRCQGDGVLKWHMSTCLNDFLSFERHHSWGIFMYLRFSRVNILFRPLRWQLQIFNFLVDSRVRLMGIEGIQCAASDWWISTGLQPSGWVDLQAAHIDASGYVEANPGQYIHLCRSMLFGASYTAGLSMHPTHWADVLNEIRIAPKCMCLHCSISFVNGLQGNVNTWMWQETNISSIMPITTLTWLETGF